MQQCQWCLSTVKPGSQYDAGAASVTRIASATEKSLFFTSQIASLTLTFSTIWLVRRWLTLAMLRWNRNRVYSSVTLTLRWRERHIVNQALVSTALHPQLTCRHCSNFSVTHFCWYERQYSKLIGHFWFTQACRQVARQLQLPALSQ